MFNLSELIKTETTKNVVKKSKVENVNTSILELLFNQGLKLDRVQLVAKITERRLLAIYSEAEIAEMKLEDLKSLINKTNMTVKNGVDQSLSRANNNSSFHNNPEYSDYLLELVKGKYQVTLIR